MRLHSRPLRPASTVVRVLVWIAAAAGALLWIHAEAQTENDFDIFLAAARDLGQEENIYTTLYRGKYHYYYSVLFAWMLQPLALLAPYWAKAVWLALNLGFLLRSARLCAAALPVHKMSGAAKALFTALAVFASLRMLRDNFHSGQLTLCLLWLSLEGLALIHRGAKLRGATLIALAINIKLLPLVLIPYLLYRREVRAAVAVVVIYTALLWLPALLVGTDYNAFLLRHWWALVNPSDARHIIDVSERGLHGLSTLLPTLFIPGVQEEGMLPLRRHLVALEAKHVAAALMAARLSLAGFTVYFLRTWPFRPAPSSLHRCWEVAYILLVVPLIFPHQQHYAFLLALPAVLYLLAYFILSRHTRRTWMVEKVLTALAVIGMNAAFLLGPYSDYYDHFKVLTWATLLLIVPLARCRPDFLAGQLVKDE